MVTVTNEAAPAVQALRAALTEVREQASATPATGGSGPYG
jgi:hypothetical protein